MKPIFTENFPGNMVRTIGKAERVEKGGAHTDTDEVRSVSVATCHTWRR